MKKDKSLFYYLAMMITLTISSSVFGFECAVITALALILGSLFTMQDELNNKRDGD